MNAVKSAMLLATTSPPIADKRSRASAAVMPLIVSLFKRSVIARGVLAGATVPNQPLVS